MQYPSYFTAEDIMEFEHEYNRYLDRQDPNSFLAVNEELQVIAHDSLERDHDEPYEPDYGDSWYEDQYELDFQ